VRCFNAGEFFEAHEVFEDLLDEVEGDERWELLVALIQIAVGYHKCVAGHPGAARMLRLGGVKLARFPAVVCGVAVERLPASRRGGRRTPRSRDRARCAFHRSTARIVMMRD